jgi:hypothetical protein
MKLFTILIVTLITLASSGEVVVTDPVATKAIDSITFKQDSINKIIYRSGHYKNMKGGSIADQVIYLKQLLHANLKIPGTDTLAILNCANLLMVVTQFDYDKLYIILNNVDDESRGMVNRHRISVKQGMASLEQFIESITPKDEPVIIDTTKRIKIEVKNKF